MRGPLFTLPLLLACRATSGPSDPADTDVASQPPSALADALDATRMLGHLDALQAAADASAGTRVIGSEGFAASVDYARQTLEAAGYAVTLQEVELAQWREVGATLLERQDGVALVDGSFEAMNGSASGDVTAAVVPVDVSVAPTGGSTSGCDAADWAGFPAGAIALIQRGTCDFYTKSTRAQEAGAVAALIFNEGTPGRTGLFSGTVEPADGLAIPVLSLSFSAGLNLLESGVPARVRVAAERSVILAHNLWADLPGAEEGLYVVGGHLDSVEAGPGVQDNGSGSALVLEMATAAREIGLTPRFGLRFALWGAEEQGLVGSYRYVDALDEDAIALHLGNLNFDMVASPNGARFVYDGDASEGLPGIEPPDGSAEIEALFTSYFDAQGQTWAATAFDGRSDYGPFLLVGVPAGGLFSGAEQDKSRSEEDAFGGVSGEPFDACYHESCDDRANVDEALYVELARAAAHASQSAAEGALDPAPRRARPRLPPSEIPPGHIGQGPDHAHVEPR
jgi:hypothetical protein